MGGQPWRNVELCEGDWNAFDLFAVCVKKHGCTVLGWIDFRGEEVCHENHENLYTTKISMLTVATTGTYSY